MNNNFKIAKYETCFKKNIIFKKTENIKIKDMPNHFENKIINIYPDIEFQTFLGFGGAITDASGYAYSKLTPSQKKDFISDYFSTAGLNYTWARLPIGSCDFTSKSYSYSNKETLEDFSIFEDKKYLLPLLTDAYAQNKLNILSSIWSPPKFMKSTKLLNLGGKLVDKHKTTLANYIAKYILHYKEEGFDINYITPQNEPNAVQVWESCLYDAKEEADFVLNFLSPTLKQYGLNTNILIWDHNKETLLNRAFEEFEEDNLKDVTCGLAYHFYSGDHFENLELFHKLFPDKLLVHSEGCTFFGNYKDEEDYKNGEIYAHDIIGDLNHYSNAYIDWNIILDSKGGPNHKFNYCNSPIMLDKSETSYVKKSSYYYIGHFSKFILPNSKRIAISKYNDNLEITAFKNSDETIAVVILNRSLAPIEFNVCICKKTFKGVINENSIITYVIKKS